MATQNSPQYLKEIAVPQQLKEPYEMAGRIRVAYATVTAATWGVGEVANLFTLPGKARIVGGYMETDGLVGAGATISLGYSGTADAIIGATAMAAAGRVQLPKLASIGVDMGGKLIIATLGTATATDGKILTVVLEFVVD